MRDGMADDKGFTGHGFLQVTNRHGDFVDKAGSNRGGSKVVPKA